MFDSSKNEWKDDRDKPLLVRSDGKTFIFWAWWMAGLALLLMTSAISKSPTNILGEFDPAAAHTKAQMATIAVIFAGLWLTFLITGHIIRALYFLPGDQMKECSETKTVRDKQRRRAEGLDAVD
ncbi:MAG: hypothetical protein R3E11_05635 [Sphingobium sp.]|mgnify:CR=1 FL=1|nr:hypothetical protein [Sphingobium sp.]MCP5398976.1 hypothetical protein [Sphingomonas sp.]